MGDLIEYGLSCWALHLRHWAGWGFVLVCLMDKLFRSRVVIAVDRRD